MMSVLLINNVVLSEKSVEFEYVVTCFLVPKRGGAIIRGGAIFGGNTVPHWGYRQ